MLSVVEQSRLKISKTTAKNKKSTLGQFFTPARIAQFMTKLFYQTTEDNCRLLDAGAGIGSLSAAFIERWISGDLNFKRVEIDAFEIDETLLPYLKQTMEIYQRQAVVALNIRSDDFVIAAVGSLLGSLFAKPLPRYTHAILNPPYKKIRSSSTHRIALRRVGIETVNLYSAFVALALALLENKGQLVAIMPRSFCNGPYYHPFRKFILERAAIRHIHLFDSRRKTFKDDNVLQENVVIMLERGRKQGNVKVSISADDKFTDTKIFVHPFHNIVIPDDPHHFIHVPTFPKTKKFRLPDPIRFSLEDIGLSVSTGPVVDFRLKEHLREMPEVGTVPLLYPGHFKGKALEWPKPGFKKPNAIVHNVKTKKWFYPNGCYCIVRRFSSKEEKRRIVANVMCPDNFPHMELLGFENHLNVFHMGRKGIPKFLAYGLATYLNSTAVDEYFRCFNGHTQVNATDLRCIQYPSRDSLTALGEQVINCDNPVQDLGHDQLNLL